MNDDARRALIDAQEKFEKDSKQAAKARCEAFTRAHKQDGLSYAEIGQVVELSKTKVSEIING